MAQPRIIEDELAMSQKALVEALIHHYGSGSLEARGKLLARFKSILKAGLPSGHRPQHGKREKYTFRQVCETFICFDLAKHFGIDAWTLKASNLSQNWSQLLCQLTVATIEDSKKEREDILIKFRMDHLTSDRAVLRVDDIAKRSDVPYIEGTGCIYNLSFTAMCLAGMLPSQDLKDSLGGRQEPKPSSSLDVSQKGRRADKQLQRGS